MECTRPRRITADEQAPVDVAAAQHEADLAAAEPLGIAHDRREAGGAGALGHGLLDLEQLQDRGLDRGLLDQQHVVDQALDDRQGQVARLLDRDALGDASGAAAPAGRPARLRYIEG